MTWLHSGAVMLPVWSSSAGQGRHTARTTFIEEICIYKRVKNRCKIHSKKKGHDELAWSARQGAFFPL